MKPTIKLCSTLLAIVVPAVAPVAFTVSPSEAATLASSRSSTLVGCFSSPAFGLSSLATTDTFTTAEEAGAVLAIGNAEAELQPSLGSTLSSGFAEGRGLNYFGFAEGEAAIIGLFEVQQVFSFRFLSELRLLTSIDNPSLESAVAFGAIGFSLFDDTTGDLLDTFGLFGSLSALGTPAAPAFQLSEFVNVSLRKSFLAITSNQSIGYALLGGKYSRSFDAPLTLRLEQVQFNTAAVQAVPSPSLLPGLLFHFVLLPLTKRKRKNADKKLTRIQATESGTR